MRNFYISMAAAALSLSGCVTTGDPNAIIAAIQNAAVIGCQFEPSPATVQALIAVGNPTVQTVTSIADLICKAVAPAVPPTIAPIVVAPATMPVVVPPKVGAQLRLRLRTTGVVVDGVLIKGRFVKS